MNHREKLAGVFVPAVTPFDNEEIRIDWLERNIAKMNAAGVNGYLALGSNGEFMNLTEEEQLLVASVFSANKADKTLMVGACRESVRETLLFIDKLSKFDIDYVSVLPPHYFAKKVSDDMILNFFTEIADRSPIPVVMYNAPDFAAGVAIKPGTAAKLAKHSNIVGMKDSSSSGIVAFLAATREIPDFAVMAGSANFFYTALIYGATGGIISLANFLPKMGVELYNLFLEGKTKEAIELHYRTFDINQTVSGKHGVSGVKAAMNILGFSAGEARRPLPMLTKAQYDEMKTYFEKERLL